MVERKAAAFCAACGKYVILNNQGKIMYHITSGKPCPGSDHNGTDGSTKEKDA